MGSKPIVCNESNESNESSESSNGFQTWLDSIVNENYLHSEGLHAGGHFATDAPQPQNGQRLSIQFVAHILLTVPDTILQSTASLRNEPEKINNPAQQQERQQQFN